MKGLPRTITPEEYREFKDRAWLGHIESGMPEGVLFWRYVMEKSDQLIAEWLAAQ